MPVSHDHRGGTSSSMHTVGPARIRGRQVQRDAAVCIEKARLGGGTQELWPAWTAFRCIELHPPSRLLACRKKEW